MLFLQPDSVYALALGMGLASGFSHCIGMCGIFVVSYAGMPEKDGERRFLYPMRHVLFHGGRLAALAVLGLAGGAIGALGHRWASARAIGSLTVGVVMLGLALGLAGLLPGFRLPEPDVLGAGGGRLRRLYLRVLQSHSVWKPLGVGIFVGFLPCGLTYNALMATFTLSPFSGALLMLLFGLGTIPGLLALALFGNALFGGLLMRLPFRLAMTRVSALFMAALGLAFVWRGWASL
jgi:sulfite exporter TauE/SafE